jgi:hypothetical protein
VAWHWDGGTWSDATPPWATLGYQSVVLSDVWAPAPGEAWAVGSRDGQGLVVHALLGSWTSITDPIVVGTGALNGIAGDPSSPGTYWIAGTGAGNPTGTILRLESSMWSLADSTGFSLDAVWVVPPGVGWAAGPTSNAFFDLGGSGWTASSDPTVTMAWFGPHSIWASSPDDLWVLSVYPANLVGWWNGATWTPQSVMAPCQRGGWDAVSGSCSSIWIVNQSGEICRGRR